MPISCDNRELLQSAKLLQKPGTERQTLHGISTKGKPQKLIPEKLEVK